MDFFQHQDRARASSLKLLVLYGFAVLGVVVALNAVAIIVANLIKDAQADHAVLTDVNTPAAVADQAQRARQSTLDRLWQPQVIGLTTLGTLGIMGLASLYRKASIAGNGAAVAEMMGGAPVDPGAAALDPDARMLLNIVEEMSIASGVPTPRVYVMDNERAINAFAAGTRPDNAVIGVTRGCIQKLTRDELQGVVAHEFSHILNGDMRLNLRMIALNFGIMAIGIIGWHILRHAPRAASGGKKDAAAGIIAIALVGLAMIIIGYVGLIFGQILQAAVSRQREFLADASAVQFTRNPSGIAGALKKIGGEAGRGRLTHSAAQEVAHMCFASGVSSWLSAIFATHPPLEERIRAIEPSWDGRFVEPEVVTRTRDRSERLAPGFAMPSGMSTRKADIGTSAGLAAVVTPPPMAMASDTRTIEARAARVPPVAGTIDAAAVTFVDQVLDSLSPALLHAAEDAFTARAVALALLIDDEPSIQHQQRLQLQQFDSPLAVMTVEFIAPIHSLPRAARLPLFDLTCRALRQLTVSQLAELRAIAEPLVRADDRLSLFELAMLKSIQQIWRDLERKGREPPPMYRSIASVGKHARLLLTAVARSGQQSDWQGDFSRACRLLDLEPTLPDRLSVADLSESLDVLRATSPAVKRRLVQAIADCVIHDGRLTLGEAEIARATCAAIDVPLPPLYAEST